MKLTEAACKRLLGTYGLKVPRGSLARTGEEAAAAAAALGGPVFVKAQIAIGDRARYGLIERATTPEEAAAAAKAILGRKVDDAVVEEVLVEELADHVEAVYVGVHVDDRIARRVLRVGTGAGAGYDPETAQVAIPLDVRPPELFEVRAALRALPLPSAQREAVTHAAFALVRAAAAWHAYTVEVNPLFVTADGKALAIDAKLDLDDYSLPIVPEPELLPVRPESPREREARIYQEADHRGTLRYLQLVDDDVAADADDRPLVASHAVGGGESLVVFDALASAGLVPTNYCDTSGAPSHEKMAFAAKLIASQPRLRGYFFSSCIANQPLSVTAAGLTDGLDQAGWRGPIVVRIAGNQEPQAREWISAWAEKEGVPSAVVGREVDEWGAAALLAELIERTEAARGVPGE